MDYRETLDWMFAQLPMYQRQGASAYKVDLHNTIELAAYLGNPHNTFKSIHVAGTNGKGSTSHMLASVLQEVGYKVGLYTSPHLKDFRERIRVNGEVVPKQYVIDFMHEHKWYFEKHHLSFFEMTVGMAFQYFSESDIDIAIIEVGLGGRLDSTNIITPEVSVITNIGIDHIQFLGDTLTEIASEKAGIIKDNIPVVVGETVPETKDVFKQKAKSCGSDLYWANDYEGKQYVSDLKGHYQEKNILTVLKTIAVLQKLGWDIGTSAVEIGLNNVVRNTGLLGRWQILQESPKVICDTAHNEDGLGAVMKQLIKENYKKLHIVLGMVRDKDLEMILPLFPTVAKYYFTKPDISRGLGGKELKEKALKYNLIGENYDSVLEAYNAALQCATDKDVIYVGGSTFVVSEII
ncbi:folylpolyglutamate synthase/dihydrofolate synthase family protein [Aquimarina sp. AU474]|uniref:bifunctional folylpolyglutamate synthase/dihydrofolate synthase n=1 Tax=Aquimarina sp. AU474 TaxID=2108529 RepID=UPI000D69B278|nr:folylpolyglutamate synthase/dihydrofolate synthase family protein [Aquimarina sp. AU474]